MVALGERSDGLTVGRLPLTGAPDELRARRDLRAQIARLDRDLSDTLAAAFPRTVVDVHVRAPSGGPRLLSFGELEMLRDEMAEKLRRARIQVARRADYEAASRALLERMLLAPGKHKFVRVANRDLGEAGCGVWHVRPRLGLIGMLAGWWHVKLSSGCPLPRSPRFPSRRRITRRWASAVVSEQLQAGRLPRVRARWSLRRQRPARHMPARSTAVPASPRRRPRRGRPFR